MEQGSHWYDDVVIPALLRHARHTYGSAMREALEEAGYDDVPANGMYVIGGLLLGEGRIPVGQLVRELRVSKQAAGQLVDTLVSRGYLKREPDDDDRRKLIVSLTERGLAAAQTQAEARTRIDAELESWVGVDTVRAMRRGLGALVDMQREERAHAD
jgi:DNA-binding MarR family transcriptional regulator